MLYSKHELVKLCTLVKIQDSESHTLVDGTYMLRSPESVHLYPLPFPTPSVHEQTLKLRMVKTKCIWPHTLITTKAYLHRHTLDILSAYIAKIYMNMLTCALQIYGKKYKFYNVH